LDPRLHLGVRAGLFRPPRPSSAPARGAWEKFLHSHKLWRPNAKNALNSLRHADQFKPPHRSARQESCGRELMQAALYLDQQLKLYRQQIEARFREHPDQHLFGSLRRQAGVAPACLGLWAMIRILRQPGSGCSASRGPHRCLSSGSSTKSHPLGVRQIHAPPCISGRMASQASAWASLLPGETRRHGMLCLALLEQRYSNPLHAPRQNPLRRGIGMLATAKARLLVINWSMHPQLDPSLTSMKKPFARQRTTPPSAGPSPDLNLSLSRAKVTY